MTLLKNKIFITSSILFTVNYILEKVFGIYVPFIHAYMDDLLCMPVVLTLSLTFLRWLINTPLLKLSPWQVVFAVAYFSVAFEIILPLLSDKYTEDILDVLAYSIGGVIFYFYINKSDPSGESVGT